MAGLAAVATAEKVASVDIGASRPPPRVVAEAVEAAATSGGGAAAGALPWTTLEMHAGAPRWRRIVIRRTQRD